MTNEYFVGEFSSAVVFSYQRSLKMSEFTGNNMTDEYFLREFSSAVLLSCKRKLKSERIDRK